MNKTFVYTVPAQKPDAAPDGAKRFLFDRSYKDFAPTDLGRDPIALEHGGIELRPDRAQAIQERVADIMIYRG